MIALEPENPTTYETQAHGLRGDGSSPTRRRTAWQRVVELSPGRRRGLGASGHLARGAGPAGRGDRGVSQARRNSVPTRRACASVSRRCCATPSTTTRPSPPTAILVRTYCGLPTRRTRKTLLADAYAGLGLDAECRRAHTRRRSTSIERVPASASPRQPEALYEQASAYDALGRQEEAIAAYERALEGDPLESGHLQRPRRDVSCGGPHQGCHRDGRDGGLARS